MEKLRIGVIGCGRISVMHFESVVASDRAVLVACADIKKDRADEKAKQYNITAYTSYEEMIEKEKLDAVHLCLPHYIHSSVAIYAMEHGLNVITEKPMDIDLKSAEKAVEVSKKTGKVFGVISQCRYNPSAQLVKKTVESGKLGKIISARSVLTWTRSDQYYSESDWKGTWDKEGGGVVIDQAIHSIDLVRWIVDSEIESVSCSMANRGHKTVFVEDSAEGLIKFKNGTVYGFWCMNNYGDDEPIEIQLFCEKGKVKFGYDDAYIKFNDGTDDEIHTTHDRYSGKVYWGNMHVNQIYNFHGACLGLEKLDIDGDEALKTHRLICEMYNAGGMTTKE